MFGAMLYENLGYYGFGMKPSQMNRARQHIKEQQGKKIICMNDGKKFLSIGEAAKHYCISACAVRRSANKNIGVSPKRKKKIYYFMFSVENGE